MKFCKRFAFILVFISATIVQGQSSESTKAWTGKTYVQASYFRLGSYVKERPTIFLEQNFSYRINERFSVGAGLGIDLYPALLALPVYANGRYHFKIKSKEFAIQQSLGRNIKVADFFYSSNRYMGGLEMYLPLKKIEIVPELGYNFLWDKYGGKSLSFLLGVGLSYSL